MWETKMQVFPVMWRSHGKESLLNAQALHLFEDVPKPVKAQRRGSATGVLQSKHGLFQIGGCGEDATRIAFSLTRNLERSKRPLWHLVTSCIFSVMQYVTGHVIRVKEEDNYRAHPWLGSRPKKMLDSNMERQYCAKQTADREAERLNNWKLFAA